MMLIALYGLTACTDLGSLDSGTSPAVTDSGAPSDTANTEAGPPNLCINEIMEDNRETLSDESGGSPSWIEIHNPERVDASLAGWTLTDDADDPRRHVFEEGMTVPSLGFLLLYADDQVSLGEDHVAFELNKIGGTLTLFTPDGEAVDKGQWIDEWDADVSRARDFDCCQEMVCWTSVPGGTPGASNVLPEVEDVPLLSAESLWRYLDDGSNQGTQWRQTNHDDESWASGPGPLGYGDDHQQTEVSSGSDSSDKHATTYFRSSFTVADPEALDSLRLELLYDDGAAVYLNGTEILRAGLPGGDLSHTTYATRTASGNGETSYSKFTATTDALVAGTNVLAVEVHQAAPDSSDLGFDLAVVGEILLLPR